MLLFIFTVVLSLAKGQDHVSYGNASSCIGNYKDLEMYVLNDKDLMEDLAEVFFKTGETAADFVRITYKFSAENISDIPIANDDGNSICTYIQKQFIWSSSALYLLGPKPLFWLTLFAVHVHESTVTINLPCLCNDVYDELLSRLTYLVLYVYNYISVYTCIYWVAGIYCNRLLRNIAICDF